MGLTWHFIPNLSAPKHCRIDDWRGILIVMQISSRVFLWTIWLSVVAVFVATGHKFLIQKNYNFLVETPCDPSVDRCFYRDCDAEECPPNGWTHYKTFLVAAGDFPQCLDNTCSRKCAAGVISCAEMVCGDAVGDECASAS